MTFLVILILTITQFAAPTAPEVMHIGNLLFYYVPDSWMFDYMKQHKQFPEMSELRALDELLNKIEHAVTFDVGANIGTHSLYWGMKQNVDQVYSFEPCTDTYGWLARHIFLNKLQRKVTTLNLGLSDKPSSASITYRPHDLDGYTVLKQDPSGEITLDTLDNTVKRFRIDRLDLLKIDVEGHELLVVRGGLETIKRFKPIIMIELWKSNSEIDTILRQMGYVVAWEEGPIIDIRKIDTLYNRIYRHPGQLVMNQTLSATNVVLLIAVFTVLGIAVIVFVSALWFTFLRHFRSSPASAFRRRLTLRPQATATQSSIENDKEQLIEVPLTHLPDQSCPS